MSSFAPPRGCPRETPLLEQEASDTPCRLSDEDWLNEACPDQRWMRGAADTEQD